MLAVGLAAVAAAVLVYRDSPGASALPAAIQAVEPEPFSNVLLQSSSGPKLRNGQLLAPRAGWGVQAEFHLVLWRRL